MTDITIRWSGPADAASGSTYKIERTLNNSSWTVLVPAQAATTPYVCVTGALAANTAFGASSIVLVNGTSFGTSGYAWIDEGLIQWTGKSTNTLTGVSWRTGYGTYASGTAVYVAHESYTDAVVTISANVVLYRLTHINAAGASSAPTYLWYYAPPTPASSAHCVVVTNIAADLGIEARPTLNVSAYLSVDTEFSDMGGLHLDAGKSAVKTVATNVFGVAFHHCWKSNARRSIRGADAVYTFELDAASADKLTVTAETIPDRDWVLLSEIGS